MFIRYDRNFYQCSAIKCHRWVPFIVVSNTIRLVHIPNASIETSHFTLVKLRCKKKNTVFCRIFYSVPVDLSISIIRLPQYHWSNPEGYWWSRLWVFQSHKGNHAIASLTCSAETLIIGKWIRWFQYELLTLSIRCIYIRNRNCHLCTCRCPSTLRC